MLIDANSSVDLVGFSGTTALMTASLMGYDAVARVLLEAGASIDIKDRHGRTALTFAIESGYSGPKVNLLLVYYMLRQSPAYCPRSSCSHLLHTGRLSANVQSVGHIHSIPPELPLHEVLNHVQWSARSVSRAFKMELEAGREELRIKWFAVDDPAELQLMVSRLPQLTSVDGFGCPG